MPGMLQVGEDRVGQQIERALERLEAVMRLLDAKAGVFEPVGEQ